MQSIPTSLFTGCVCKQGPPIWNELEKQWAQKTFDDGLSSETIYKINNSNNNNTNKMLHSIFFARESFLWANRRACYERLQARPRIVDLMARECRMPGNTTTHKHKRHFKTAADVGVIADFFYSHRASDLIDYIQKKQHKTDGW